MRRLGVDRELRDRSWAQGKLLFSFIETMCGRVPNNASFKCRLREYGCHNADVIPMQYKSA